MRHGPILPGRDPSAPGVGDLTVRGGGPPAVLFGMTEAMPRPEHRRGRRAAPSPDCPFEPVYGPEPARGLRPGDAARRAGRVPVHPRRLPDDVHRRGRGRCGSTPASAPPRSPTSATSSWSPTAPAACRWPSTCRPRWATTPTPPIAHGEVGKVGVAIDSIDDMRVLFDGIPLDQVSTSMTINAPGRGAAAAVPARRRGARRRRATSSPARSRTTCSRSTSPAAPTSTRRSTRCG